MLGVVRDSPARQTTDAMACLKAIALCLFLGERSDHRDDDALVLEGSECINSGAMTNPIPEVAAMKMLKTIPMAMLKTVKTTASAIACQA